MRLNRSWRATAACTALVLGLAACGGADDDSGESDGNSESPTGVAGGTYSAELTEPTFLAPASNCYESECSAVLDLINDPLVSTDFESGELIYDVRGKSERPHVRRLTQATAGRPQGTRGGAG